jgi:proline iminopeptidase
MRLSKFFILRSAFCVLMTLSASAATLKTEDGVTLHYDVIGKGRPVVMLSGGPGFSPEYLRPIAERLKGRYQFILLDQRGTGRSRMDVMDATTLDHKRLVADVEALRRALKQEKLTLVGHSWGGILSMLYASEHPDRVRALALVDAGGPTIATVANFAATHTARMTEEDSAKVKEAYGRLATDHKRAILDITRARTPPYFYDRAKAQAFMDALHEDSFNDAVFWPIVGQITGSFDLRPGLKRVNVPVLVIHGRHDPLQSAQEVHEALAGSRLEIIDEAGHFPWVEQPDVFFRLLDGFLRSVVR